MADDRAQFEARLFATFVKEAHAHAAAIPGLLEELEHRTAQPDAALRLLREIHSLKGAAGAVEQDQVEFLCRSLEQVLLKVQRGEQKIDADVFDLFRCALGLLNDGLAEIAQGGTFSVSLQFLERIRKLT